MDPLHRQAVLDCYEDISRDMDPKLVLRYGTVLWRDEDSGFIRAKERTEGPHFAARALLDKLLELPYDAFDDFIQSLRDVPYDHLVKQLLDTRTRLQTAVENGKIRKKDLGRRRQDITRWPPSKVHMAAIGILAGLILIIFTTHHTYETNETSLMTVFPRRLKTFVGREDVFGKIDSCLEQNQTCLVRGLGGIGKTTLAIEYGHRRAETYYGRVFWVRLASTRDLCSSISQYISYASGRPKREVPVLSGDDMGCKSMKKHFREYLTNTQHWLLVADEAVRETMKELGSLLPHTLTGSMHTLLTSQEYQRLDMERISVVDIPPFSHTEALAMFHKIVRPGDKNDKRAIRRLSRSLGHHPLALQFAFAYISATGSSIEDYHAKYIESNATQKVELLDKADIEQTTNRRIRQTFHITFQYVSNLSINAAKLINMTAFMGPDCIPCPEPESHSFARLFTSAGELDKLDTIEMVSILERFSLASYCHLFQLCGFSVNRIVQEVIVAEMNESLRLIHFENALEYATLFIKSSNDTSRVQAEYLMTHVHYLALNLDRYQTRAPFPASSIFLNGSVEFFCQWGACEEAYFFLPVEVLLSFKYVPIQRLSCHFLDHVNFLRNTLLPCLYKGDASVELLVNIADTLYWQGAEVDHKHFSSNATAQASCDIVLVFMDVLDTCTGIYKRLLQRKQLEYLDYSNFSIPLLMSLSSYIEETPFEDLESLFIPNPDPSTTPDDYWKGLSDIVAYAGAGLHPEITQNLYFSDLSDFSFVKDVHIDSSIRCFWMSRDILQHYKYYIQRANKIVTKVLFMYYRFMTTDTCTDRYYEVMLGLPRESKEFDILTFAREDHELLGDPEVVKSVLSLTSTQNPKFKNSGRNLHPVHISPLSFFEFHAEVRLKHKVGVLIYQLEKDIHQAKALGETTPAAECKALMDAVHSLKKDRKATTWKQLDSKYTYRSIDRFLEIFKGFVDRCRLFRKGILVEKHSITGQKRNQPHPLSEFIDTVIRLMKDDVRHPFVEKGCSFACPAFKAVFDCESCFPNIMWVWNRLQDMEKYVDCSLQHGGVNMPCCAKFLDALGSYLNATIYYDLSSKQSEEEMLFGQPLSEEGETFHFVQGEDKVIGMFHKVRGFSMDKDRLPVFEQDIRTSNVRRKKTKTRQ